MHHRDRPALPPPEAHAPIVIYRVLLRGREDAGPGVEAPSQLGRRVCGQPHLRSANPVQFLSTEPEANHIQFLSAVSPTYGAGG